jgi:hypothetical protein
MKKLVLLSVMALAGGTLKAQLKVGDHPTTIGTGQLFELEKKGQRGGLKLAEVALTGPADRTTIAILASAAGTMVWNKGTAGLSPAGIYVWTGTEWVQAKTENLYTANGTLAGNRTVALANRSLAFTSTATTGTSHFSVDGTTFNVDAHNNRVGIGTAAPTNNLEVTGAGGTATGLTLPTGASAGKVLVSDANGNASWQNSYSVIYSEIHCNGYAGYSNANSKITAFSLTKADNVKERYGAAYGWDNTNKRWVAPFSGRFRLTMNADFREHSQAPETPGMIAYKNGTEGCAYIGVFVDAASGANCSSTSVFVELSEGDYIEFRTGGGRTMLYGYPNHTFFRVESVD